MTKAELAAKIAEKSGLAKTEASNVLEVLTGIITSSLASGEKLTLTGFGAFEVASRAARKGRNPKTGQEIEIPASKSVKFKVGTGLKNGVK